MNLKTLSIRDQIQALELSRNSAMRDYNSQIENLYFKFTVEVLQEFGFIEHDGINMPIDKSSIWLYFNDRTFQYNYQWKSLHIKIGPFNWHRIADPEELKQFLK